MTTTATHRQVDVGCVVVVRQVGVMSHVTGDDELGESLVLERVDEIAHDAEHVETRQNRLRQVHLPPTRHALVLHAPEMCIEHDSTNINSNTRMVLHYDCVTSGSDDSCKQVKR